MKHQSLFYSKDLGEKKKNKIKVSSAAILPGCLSVNR